MFDEHFHADEDEDDREADLEKPEERHDAAEREVERTQAENREDVRGERHEAVLRDREHGRQGVEGEDDVGRLDDDQDDEHRRGHALAVVDGEEVAVVVFGGDGEEAAEEPHGGVVLGVDVGVFAGEGHLDAGVDEERAEDVEDPVKARDDAHADQNEDRAHHDGADDAPEEHAVLEARLDLEVGEDENEHEDVVHAQAEFDEIAGEELLTEFGSAPPPDHAAEREGEGAPDGAPPERLLHRNDMRVALKHAEVEREHGGDEEEKRTPSPKGHGVDGGEKRKHGRGAWPQAGAAGKRGVAGWKIRAGLHGRREGRRGGRSRGKPL